MAVRTWVVGGSIATVLVLSGCGSTSHKTASTPASTKAPAGPTSPGGALPPGAPPALAGVAGRVLVAGDLEGFAPQGRRALGVNARSWVLAEEVPAGERASEAGRLERLGFVAGVRERLAPTREGSAEAISVVEQFRSPRAARETLAFEVKTTEAHGARPFEVSKIPTARGFGGRFGPTTGYNVAFLDGDYYYLVGAGFPTGTRGAPTEASLITAARRLYARVHG